MEVIAKSESADGVAVDTTAWLPVMRSDEITERYGHPVALDLLGRELIAFRGDEDRVALMGRFCPHRLASLRLGRNEPGGLRCVYHGWKFDSRGSAIECPGERSATGFARNIKTERYPTVEIDGILFAFLGEGVPPAEPTCSSGLVPLAHVQG